MRGIVNIVFGVILVAGGLSGKLVLRGTHNGLALAAIGAVLIALGIYRIVKARSAQK